MNEQLNAVFRYAMILAKNPSIIDELQRGLDEWGLEHGYHPATMPSIREAVAKVDAEIDASLSKA